MMGVMDVTSRIEFAADADTVHAMMIDEDYLIRVCEATGSKAYSVSVDGDTTRSDRTLESPPAAAKFTGPTLQVVEVIAWQPKAADGTRIGDIETGVPGQPVTLKGTITAEESGGSTVLTLTGDLKVNIPLLGRKLEQAAAPAMVAGFRTHQQVGDRWLAEH